MDNVKMDMTYAEAAAMEVVLADYIQYCKKTLTEVQQDKTVSTEHRKAVVEICRTRGSHAKKFLDAVRQELDKVEA